MSRYIQHLAIRHDQFQQFMIWAESIPFWTTHLYSSRNLTFAVQTCPELIETMFKLCPFQTNRDAVSFLCSLMESDRKEIFLRYAKTKFFRQTISLFNRLGDEAKQRCQLWSTFFSYPACEPRSKFWYLEYLFSKAHLKLPTKLSSREVYVDEKLELLRFLFARRLLSKSHIFIEKDDWFYARRLKSTGENLQWLLEEKPFEVTSEDVHRMAEKLFRIDRQFLMLYKSFCQVHGRKMLTFEWLFQRALEEDADLETIDDYFEFRFETRSPSTDEVGSIMLDNGFSVRGFPNYDDEYGNSFFMRTVRRFGPHFFVGMLSCRFSRRKEQAWLSLMYWFWRIANNPDNPIPAAWNIPTEITKVILSYVIEKSDDRDKLFLLCHEWDTFANRRKIRRC